MFVKENPTALHTLFRAVVREIENLRQTRLSINRPHRAGVDQGLRPGPSVCRQHHGRSRGRPRRPRLTLPCGIAHHRRARRNIPGDHAASSDDGIVPDADTGKDDGPAADPDVPTNAHRLAALQALPAEFRIAWVVRREDMNVRADLAASTALDTSDIEEAAATVQHGPTSQDRKRVVYGRSV